MTPLEDGSTPEPQPAATPEVTQGAPAEAPAPPLSLAEECDEQAEEQGEPRRYPSTIGGALYLLVLLVTILALVVVSAGHWRGGVHILAGALVAAAIPRALLRERDAGMLEVRGRWFDVTLLVVVGVAMWVLASTIPAQG